ncbi:MAG: two-component system, NtrC family, nitrogen regulation sensor histidine kinase NtrY [Blastocatellia bacterium]|jgi:PAS domain S-box-containing protein|nr:two-component system, NtrC family, nitrogen regulation sensor histidine kinase NtrY [Blastocatellia bacterium]
MKNNTPTTERTQPQETSHRRRSAPWILGGTVLLLLAIIVAQQVFNLWAVVPPDTGSDTLLLYALSSLNFAAFVVFSFILVRSVLKLRRERRERQLGSKIKTRLLVYFITLSLLPITAMAAFSYLFLNRSLEKWFHNFPEEVVKEAREFQTETLQRQAEDMRGSAALLAAVIREQPPELRQQTLERLVATGQLVAIEITQSDGATIAKARGALPQQRQDEVESLLARAHRGEPLENLADGKGYDLVSIPLSDHQSLLMVPTRRGALGLNETIAGSQSEYQHLVNRQRKVRLLGLSTLGLMTLMLLFASTWVAIHLARGIATPIKSLAEAANEVARGNLAHRVSTVADDELALLAESFNQMTEQLDDNRRHIETGAAELRDKNLALNERRNYIETVLDSLSSGVISLDESDQVTTMNAAAATMLRRTAIADRKMTLADVISSEDRVLLDRLLRRARRIGRATEQAELTRGLSPEAGALPVALTATALGSSANGKRGVVLVMEDLSELLAAQRAAAWSEVARRMAHEIKNPLTPIQLSAERIARNFRTEANGEGNGDGDKVERARVNALVEECTSTISREVAGLKAMVDEFSRFARLPHPNLEVGDLNEVVRQAAALYEDRTDGAELKINLAAALPEGVLDQEQMRRVFVNLIDNSLAAFNGSSPERRITITTAHDVGRDTLVAEVADTGEGIASADLKRLFQPYFSTRERGTGLGLAIVQRIITEHGGRIRAEPNQPLGARFVIELPAASS